MSDLIQVHQNQPIPFNHLILDTPININHRCQPT